eukprot:Phypoly_transcript_06750.p1 GENE.Phypoly_transcript_06750~~Phypoly_transcript_06750.p1  ORF type:complete len:496 (+),score=86.72 Phypoly_transcript_06750:172-1659(+)
MPEEDEERLLFGMDAEHADKMKEKLKSNPEYEKQALEWIATVTGEALQSNDVFTALKSGIVLCKLANKIKPGVVRNINTKTIAVCERENIKSYIRACTEIGVPNDELFDVGDLHDKKSINAVIVSIYALGRVVQTLPTFSGPTLGVKYSEKLEEKQRREEKKHPTTNQKHKKNEEEQQERKVRREELESEKTERRLLREDTVREKIKGRRIKKGRRISSSVYRLSSNFGVSPPKFGMDHEHQKKMEERQMMTDADYEDKALDWIEEITGAELDDFYKSLKSGVVLCQLANCVQPGIIPKINTRKLPAVHRENIQLYLNACEKFGISNHEMFTVSDLYDRKMMSAVVVNIYALARLVDSRPTITATLSTKNGKSIMVSKKPKLAREGSARSLRRSQAGLGNSGGLSPSKLGSSAGLSSKFGNSASSSSKFGNSGNSSSSKLGKSGGLSSSKFGNNSPKSSRASRSYRPGDPSLTQPLLDEPVPVPEKSRSCCCVIM